MCVFCVSVRVRVQHKRSHREILHPAEALNADVERIRPTRGAVDDAVLQLIVGRRPSNPAEELTAILHQYCTGRERERKHNIVKK